MRKTERALLASAIGSTAFIVIPYIFNLYAASQIKSRHGVVGRNQGAQIWLTSHSHIFTAFVMLSGSTYTAMQLFSSNIFGMQWLNLSADSLSMT